MWYILIAELLFLSLFTFHSVPSKWMKNKKFLIFYTIFHLIGLSSVIILLFFFYKIDNLSLKETIIKIESIYISFTIFSFVLSLYRSFLFYASRHSKNMKIRDAVLSPSNYVLIVIILTILYSIVGFRNADSIVKKTYTIESEKIDNFKIAMVSDLHIGAGANSQNLDDMVDIVNDMKADCLLICGDITDSSTSVNDLKYLKESLLKIKTTYGIYAIEGNHEEQCHYDTKQYLKDAKVTFLHDNLSLIKDEIVIVGRCDKLSKDIDEIKKGINDKYTICLQHRPKHLNDIKDDTDLVLCGHTHGYQYPFVAVTTPLFDMREGIKYYDDMTAITSSGLSQWGYHTKWPSRSEVVEIIIE